MKTTELQEIIFPVPLDAYQYQNENEDDCPDDLFIAVDDLDNERFVVPRHRVGSYTITPYDSIHGMGWEINLITGVKLDQDDNGTFFFRYQRSLVSGQN